MSNNSETWVGDKNILHSSVPWNDETLLQMPHLKEVEQSGIVRVQGNMTTPLVHGMLVSSLFSSIFGTISPGCVYMNQTLNFGAPVHAEELVVARLEIEKIRKWRKGGIVVQCETQVMLPPTWQGQPSKAAITGTANVWLPSGYTSSQMH